MVKVGKIRKINNDLRKPKWWHKRNNRFTIVYIIRPTNTAMQILSFWRHLEA